MARNTVRFRGVEGKRSVKKLAGDFAETQDVGAGDLAAFNRHAAHGPEPVVDEIDHQAGGNEIEHDGGDDDVAAALGLQVARDPGPESAKQHRRQNGERDHNGPGQEFKAEAHNAQHPGRQNRPGPRRRY